MFITHKHIDYKKRQGKLGDGKYNGAYYYSQEIVDNIVPRIKTDRHWMTINVSGYACDHAIFFIHNNVHPELYEWLALYKDLVLVCGIPETCDKVKHLGTPIYLPLSVDVGYLEQFKTEKTRNMAFVGRQPKRVGHDFPPGTDFIEKMPRDELLTEMAKYKKIFAVGRTAIEGKVLGCEILPYDERFPDPDFWQVLDNKDAADILQKKLDEIDRVRR